MAKIALGTWAWGAGAFGGDAVFGSKTDVNNLKPVFDAAMQAGLNLWDTATVYGMGESEKILGTFVAGVQRDAIQVSTKFTPQLAEIYDNSVEKMAMASIERMGCDYIDIYWIHNPMDVERWTPGLIPLLQSGKVKRVGVSNHNIAEIKRANEILGEAGFKVSAVQNHFSLLYRSSEKAVCWTTAARTALSSGPTWCWSRVRSAVSTTRRTRCPRRATAARSTTPCWSSSQPSPTS